MALFPEGYLKAVVSLGLLSEDSFVHKGTGFLYQHPMYKEDDRTFYYPFLVTNNHVREEGISHIRFNRVTDDSLQICPIDDVTNQTWARHVGGADVVAIPVNDSGALMKDRDTVAPEIFDGDVGAISDEELPLLSEGNGVFLFGFPLGQIGERRSYPVVRQGIVSRIQDWKRGDADTFLIDAPSFPGNSGGPVILKPESVAVGETRPITHALLIGVVRGYVPSEDILVGQNDESRVMTIRENSGLAEVVPIDAVKETIAAAIVEPGPEQFRWRPKD